MALADLLRRIFGGCAAAAPGAPARPGEALAARAAGDDDFHRWSGPSQTDHADGPTVLFHSSRMPITRFWPLSHFGTIEAATERISKSTHYGDAATGVPDGAHLYPVFLRIRHALDLPDLGMHTKPAYRQAMEASGILSADEIRHIFDETPRSAYLEPVLPASYDVFPADERAPMRRSIRAAFNRYKSTFDAESAELAGADFFEEDSRNPDNVWVQRLCQTLMAKGYDGIRYHNNQEHKDSISWVILHPSQVRSAISAHPEQALFDATREARRTALGNKYLTGRVSDSLRLGMTSLKPDIFSRYRSLEPGNLA